jgi:hypothetical protein
MKKVLTNGSIISVVSMTDSIGIDYMPIIYTQYVCIHIRIRTRIGIGRHVHISICIGVHIRI